MAKISFEILGKKKVSKILSNLKIRLGNLKPAWRHVADNFREVEKLTFEKQGRSSGHWKPLTPKYAAWKAKNYPGRPIMVLHGDLRQSLTFKGGNHIERLRRMNMEVGTKDPKGIWHQTGAGKLPKRKVIDPTGRDKTEWIHIIRNYIIEKLGFRKV